MLDGAPASGTSQQSQYHGWICGWWGRSWPGWKARAGTGLCKPTGNLLSGCSKRQEAGHGLSPSSSLQLNIDKGGLFLRDG